MRLLLIEDDEILLNQLRESLQKAGFEIDCSIDGEDGLYRAREFSYDLAIVDIGLPKLSGIEVITQLRGDSSTMPILLLTARSSWQDKVFGLKAGADDYLVKPFQLEELIARIHALLRRSAGYARNELQHGPLSLNMDSNEFKVSGKPIVLTTFEYKLIEYFMLHPQRITTKTALADYLYEEDCDPESNVIEVIVARVRKKIDPDGTLKPIETLRGRGYRFGIASK